MLTSKSDEIAASGPAQIGEAGSGGGLQAPHSPAWRDALEGVVIGVLFFLVLAVLFILGGSIFTHSLW